MRSSSQSWTVFGARTTRVLAQRRLPVRGVSTVGVAMLAMTALAAGGTGATAQSTAPARNPAKPGAQQAVAALPFDHIQPYDEMTSLLKSWAAARPDLVELTSIGRTPKGRELWFLTITNHATGPASEKPALLVEGHQHASEWVGGVAALHFAWRLVRDHGSDPGVTRLLDTRAVYLFPRMTPDGVDAVLAEGRFIRSADRPVAGSAREAGVHARDIDGDGRTVFVRFRDPNGPWKLHPTEPRLLVARAPDEYGGDYWRVVPEGAVVDYDGDTVAEAKPFEPLDFGQNFPADRRSSPENPQAGAYAGSEPEVAAYMAAIAARPNIVAHVTCHTFGGVILTPPVNADDPFPDDDRLAYQTFTREGSRLTGYDALSYLDLRGPNRQAYLPSAFGWLYDRRGIFSFITEFWNPWKAAGVKLEGLESLWLGGFHPVEDEVKMLHWSDEQVGGRCFVPWHAFNHPQLGAVEVGGWDVVGCLYNMPFDHLEREVAPHTQWLVFLGLSMPRLEVRSFSATRVAEGVWRVRLTVQNAGWLPTSGSRQAIDRSAVGETIAELSLAPDAHLVTGETRRSLGQLEGRSHQRSTATWWGYVPGTPDRAVAEWIVAARAGSTLLVNVHHDRAGTARASLVLGARAN